MTERLGYALSQAEPATYVALKMHGYQVEYYGQGLLNDQAREMLRGVPTPQRWIPDFLVTRPQIVGRPRWPEAERGKYTFLVDAKYSWGKTANQSVEMRSLLAGPTFGMDVYYVCSRRRGDDLEDFGVIRHEWVAARSKPCCASCWQIMYESRDPMRELPERCPQQARSREASGTPYVVLPRAELHPLSSSVFDNLAAAWWPKGRT